MEYRFSNHASQQLRTYGRRQIKIEWIERTLEDPDDTEVHNDPEIKKSKTYHWKRIPEYGNLPLKVIYNHRKNPVLIITVHFDRRYKK